jgi:sec-independent protein translocase protein TatA
VWCGSFVESSRAETLTKSILQRGFLAMTPLFGFFNLGGPEMIFLLILGVLLFGRKLPEVGRYLGKGIVEFKKGIKGLEDEFDSSAAAQPRQEPMALEQPRPPQRITTTAPKFEDNITTPSNSITTPPKA